MRESQAHRHNQPSVTGSSSLSSCGREIVHGALPDRDGAIDYQALRQAVTIAQVLELLGWAPVSQTGAQLRGACPIHKSSSERSRSFSVNLEKHVFQCFSCGKKGNHLDLWQTVTGLPIYEAALDLACRLHVDLERIHKARP